MWFKTGNRWSTPRGRVRVSHTHDVASPVQSRYGRFFDAEAVVLAMVIAADVVEVIDVA